MKYKLLHGDCLKKMAEMDDNSFHAIVTDPPYGLSFMNQKWDYEVPSVEIWREAYRVLKPGGYLLSFAGSRTYHRMAVNIEDAGFEIRDQIMWVYGSGFPKSHNISKAIDKKGGQSISWFGKWFKNWRIEQGLTKKEVATHFLSKNGKITGCVFNWEEGRSIPTNKDFNKLCELYNLPFPNMEAAKGEYLGEITHSRSGGDDFAKQVGSKSQSKVEEVFATATEPAKKWEGWGSALKPAHEPIVVARKPLIGTIVDNVLEHGSGGLNIDACRVKHNDPMITRKDFESNTGDIFKRAKGDEAGPNAKGRYPSNFIHDGSDEVVSLFPEENARFFYCAKASQEEKHRGIENNNHPTVKPVDLMKYLCRLITPPNGMILDPFMGSGTTGIAATQEGFNFVGIEMNDEYIKIANHRISHWVDEKQELILGQRKQKTLFQKW